MSDMKLYSAVVRQIGRWRWQVRIGIEAPPGWWPVDRPFNVFGRERAIRFAQARMDELRHDDQVEAERDAAAIRMTEGR